MATRVNTVSIGASSTGATAYSVTIPAGTGIIAGDLIVVTAASNGTHVLNGQSVQDNVNLVNYTTIKEQQQGGSSTHYQQTFYYQTPANIPDGSTITYTPFAGSTANAFCVDIFRSTSGSISNAVTSQANTASASQSAPALAAAPVIGYLVLTMDAATTGTLTAGGAFTTGSSVNSAGQSVATGYVLQASGTSTYASTWTCGSSQTSAAQTVAFAVIGIGVPYVAGSNPQAAGSASTVANVTLGSNAGDALFCIAGGPFGTSVAPTGVTDSKSHTWTLAGSVVAGSGMAAWVYQSLNATTPLVAGTDTVTVSWNSSSGAKNVLVLGCSGVNFPTALDQTANATGASTSPSATTPGSLATANELAIAVVTSGSASLGSTWSAGWTDQTSGGLHSGAGAIYTSVATQVINGSTSPVSANDSLGASAVWAELLLTFQNDPPAGGASGTLTITSGTGSSPPFGLPGGTVNVAYSDTLTATGGTQPYQWSVSAGTPPAGTQLSPGGTGGTSAIQRAGFTSGATGSMGLTESDWATDYHKFLGSGSSGTGLFVKMFEAGGSSAALPATWAATSGSTAPAVDIANAFPGVTPAICWNAAMQQSAITAFCNSIPTGQQCAFMWQQEQENGGISSSFFLTNWTIIYNAVRASKNSANLYVIPASAGFKYTSTSPSFGTGFLPPPSQVDAYGCDTYYHLGKPPPTGLQDYSTFQNWLTVMGKVNGGQKPLAIPEYGIDTYALGNSASAQALRAKYLQNDITWINAQFNNASGVSAYPLWGWMYWDRWTKGPGSGPEYGPLTDSTAISEWAGLLTQAMSGSGGGKPGGILYGTPTAAGTSTFTVRVQDAASPPNTATKQFTLTISGTGTLQVATTTLDGATVGTPYTATLQGGGGTLPYTWSIISGSISPLTLTGSTGVIAGTPSAVGTLSFTVKVTDSASPTPNTATQALTIAVSTGLTVTTTSLTPGTAGTAYSTVLQASGGTAPLTWALASTSSNDLPPGLSLDLDGSATGTAGTIFGTPTVVGSYTLTFTVTDAAGATATSAPLTLAVNASGGLPAIGRRQFGGDLAGWTFAFSGSNLVKAANVNVTFWTALSGGTQITDLETYPGGSPITSVTTDANGEFPVFQGPAGTWIMAADANGGAGPRKWILAQDVGAELNILYNAVAGLVG